MVSGPKLVFAPSVCCQPSHYAEVFVGGDNINILGGSVLIVTGKGKLRVESLKLDGALVIETGEDPNATTVLTNIVVENASWTEKPIAEVEAHPEWVKMRGYTIEKTETCTITALPKRGKGKYGVSGAGYRVDAGAGQTEKWKWIAPEGGKTSNGGGKGVRGMSTGAASGDPGCGCAIM